MQHTEEQVLLKYEDVIKNTAQKIASLKVKIDRFSFVRVALLIVEIILFILFVSAQNELLITIIGVAMLVPIAVFVVVVKKQNRLAKEETYFKNLLWVFENEVKLIDQKGNGYNNGAGFEDENHPYLSDLDIFGKSSLFALINRCSTQNGINLLADKLAAPITKEAIN